MKLKLHLLLFYPSTWYIRDFFLFHVEIEGKGGWIIWWEGGGSPSQIINYWVGGLAPPWGEGGGSPSQIINYWVGGLAPPPPSTYAYGLQSPMANVF